MIATALTDEEVLTKLGVASVVLLGAGHEAQVYAMSDNRVARIMRPGSTLAEAEARAALLREIADSAATLSFHTPVVRSVELIGDRVVVIERLMPGSPYQPYSNVYPALRAKSSWQTISIWRRISSGCG